MGSEVLWPPSSKVFSKQLFFNRSLVLFPKNRIKAICLVSIFPCVLL